MMMSGIIGATKSPTKKPQKKAKLDLKAEE